MCFVSSLSERDDTEGCWAYDGTVTLCVRDCAEQHRKKEAELIMMRHQASFYVFETSNNRVVATDSYVVS